MSGQVRVAETLDHPKDLGHVPVNAKSSKYYLLFVKQIRRCVYEQVTDYMDEKGNMNDLGMSVL